MDKPEKIPKGFYRLSEIAQWLCDQHHFSDDVSKEFQRCFWNAMEEKYAPMQIYDIGQFVEDYTSEFLTTKYPAEMKVLVTALKTTFAEKELKQISKYTIEKWNVPICK